MKKNKVNFDQLLESAKKFANDDKDPIASEILEIYLKNSPENAYAWFLFGDTLRVIGRFNESEKALLKALKIAPIERKYLVQIRLALLYSDSGKFNKAEFYFNKASEDNYFENFGWFWLLRGTNYSAMNNLEFAEECYLKAIKLKDGDVDEAYLNLGLLYRAQRKYKKAEEAFKKSLNITPKYVEAKEALKSIENIDEVFKEIK